MGIKAILVMFPVHGCNSFHSRAANSAVKCGIWLKFKLIQDVMIIIITSNNEEDLIKIEGAGVATTLKIDFSNIQGQITLQSRVESGSNSNSSKMLWLSCKNEEDPIKIEGARVATIQNIDFSNTKGQLTPQSDVKSG